MHDVLLNYDVESYKPCFVLKGTMKEICKTLDTMVNYELWRKYGKQIEKITE